MHKDSVENASQGPGNSYCFWRGHFTSCFWLFLFLVQVVEPVYLLFITESLLFVLTIQRENVHLHLCQDTNVPAGQYCPSGSTGWRTFKQMWFSLVLASIHSNDFLVYLKPVTGTVFIHSLLLCILANTVASAIKRRAADTTVWHE